MAKFLMVDDEERIRNIVKEYCEFEGYDMDEASDGIEAVEKAKNNGYDLIIMDAMMPRLDGFSAVKEIRKFSNVPVIMLSARVEEYDKLHGFDIGVDDYVTKPFSPKELMARASAVLRRGTVVADKQNFGDLLLDYSGRAVYVGGKKLTMTPKERDMLFILAKNNGTAFSREELLEKVWGADYDGDARTVDTHIKMLRNCLGEEFRDKILTVRGVGYKAEL